MKTLNDIQKMERDLSKIKGLIKDMSLKVRIANSQAVDVSVIINIGKYVDSIIMYATSLKRYSIECLTY